MLDEWALKMIPRVQRSAERDTPTSDTAAANGSASPAESRSFVADINERWPQEREDDRSARAPTAQCI